MAAVEQMTMPLTLDIGGATVDASELGTVTWPAELKELDREFKKGCDVRVTFVARVVNVDAPDKYDKHGNIESTTRRHFLRVDEVETVELVGTDNFTTVAEAAAEEAKAAADAAADGGGES